MKKNYAMLNKALKKNGKIIKYLSKIGTPATIIFLIPTHFPVCIQNDGEIWNDPQVNIKYNKN